MNDTSRAFLRAAAILGFLAVMAGTFGAHGLPESMEERLKDTFDTGVRYHLVHALALLGCAGVCREGRPAKIAYWGFVAGTVLFSGSLYALALTNESKLGMIAPIGGLAYLAGWFALILEANRES